MPPATIDSSTGVVEPPRRRVTQQEFRENIVMRVLKILLSENVKSHQREN